MPGFNINLNCGVRTISATLTNSISISVTIHVYDACPHLEFVKKNKTGGRNLLELPEINCWVFPL